MLAFYIGAILLLNLSFVQHQLSVFLSGQLSAALGTRISIGNVNLGLLNRIIIEDLQLDAPTGKQMLKAARLSAKFDILPLFNGRVSISNIQLFGFDIALEKATPQSDPNFQFILDALAPKDTVKKETRLDLRINSLLVRRGEVSYDVLSEEKTPGRFNPNHLRLNNIIASISLKALQSDSINASIKRLSVEEQNSGLQLKKLSLRLTGNEQGMYMNQFAIDLPHTSIQTDAIHVRYDSLEAFKDPMRRLRFAFHLKPSKIVLQDLAPLLPAFASFKDPLLTEIKADGPLDQLNCSSFLLSSLRSHFYLRGDVSFQDLATPGDARIFANLPALRADSAGIAFLTRNLNIKEKGASILQNLGSVFFRGKLSGYFSDLVTYGWVQTDLGNIQTDIKVTSDKGRNSLAYSGKIATGNFDLGALLANDKLGKIALNLDLKGEKQNSPYPFIILKGLISSLDYSQYTYQNITLDGEYKQGGFNGRIALDDTNGTVVMNGSFNTASDTPTFNFLATFDHVRPHDLHLTDQYEGAELSARLKADFIGGSIEQMDGEINLDSLTFVSQGKRHFLDNLRIKAANPHEQEKSLSIQSNFMEAIIAGDYAYRTLPSSFLNIMQRYMPALTDALPNKRQEPSRSKNKFRFDLHLYDTDLVSTLLNLPLKVYAHSTVKGYFDDEAKRMRIEGYFPRLRYKDKFIESGMFLCENPHDLFHASVRLTNRKPDGAVNISLDAQARNDSVQATLYWGNSSDVTYSGRLATLTRFIRENTLDSLPVPHKQVRKAPLKTIVHIQPTEVIINDTTWQIRPSEIVIDSGKVHIGNFNFNHQDRHLNINGTLSKSLTDTVRIDLQDINIGYVFDIADLGVNFQGEATGPAFACGVLDKPVMSTDLSIRNFGLNEGLLGDAQIHGEWHHDVKGIYLDARIREGDIARTHVHGFIYPIKPTSSLDLQIDAEGTNMKFIHHYMQSITSDFGGRVWGDVHFYGRFKALTMEGHVRGDAWLKVDVLNTTYSIKDSILIEPNGLTFRNNRIIDTQGHEGRVNGYLRYQHFKNLAYRFNFGVHNMLVMNTAESPDYPFFGTVYGTGNASIEGNANDGVSINVAMTTNRNTTFTYIKDNVSTAANNQFIRFVDKTPRRITHDNTLSDFETARQEIEADAGENTTDIRLNLLVDATPDATMRIIMDPMAGDYISAKGSGNLRTEFFNKGDVKMFGNYRIDQGIYKFSLQEVIRKDFLIEEGSSIAFNGSPLDAFLDIRAAYTVNSASLNDLIPDASNYASQTNVKVNCIMDISGQLTSPDIKLDLELPNEREEIQALVRNYIPTDEQKSMQILYLLGIGKFYTPENAGTTQNSNMMSSVLSSTLSGQLNNALSQIINNNNWNIGTNFSTGEKGWTDMEFEGMLSGQLLNNRLLINGNFGYRDNPLSNTNFVGDFEAEWLVNRSGDIRLRAYNETNDRYYTRTNLTTQGIGIIFKKDFERWEELLFWKKWKLRLLRKKRLENRTDSLANEKEKTE